MNKFEFVEIGANCLGSSLARVMGCKATQLRIKYLGILLGAKHKDGRSWDSVIDMFKRRLTVGKRKFLSKGGRLTLIKSTLSNLPIYYLFVLTGPAKVTKKVEMIQCRFLWGG